MFCGECGTQNPDTNQFCKNCGKLLKRPQQQAPTPYPEAAPAPAPAAPLQPVQPVYYQPPPAGVQPQAVAAGLPVKPPLNKGLLALGIVGIVIGIVSWFFYPYLCGILAVVLGGVTFYKAENKMGVVAILAIVAIVIGLASVVVTNFYLVLFPPTMGFEAIYWLT